MNTMLVAGGLCALAVVAETVCAGSGAGAAMKRLRQPRWSLPLWSWYVVGLGYYAVCFFVLLRVLEGPAGPLRAAALAFLLVLMAANAAWNGVFFRLGSLRAAFWYLIPYGGLAVALLGLLALVDAAAAAVFAVYVAYLPYACAWTRAVWRLNSGPVESV